MEPEAAIAEAELVPVRLAVDVVEAVASLRLRVKELVVITPLAFSVMEKAEPAPFWLAEVRLTVWRPASRVAFMAMPVPAEVVVLVSAALPEVVMLLPTVIVEPVRLRAPVDMVPAVVMAPASETVTLPAVVKPLS